MCANSIKKFPAFFSSPLQLLTAILGSFEIILMKPYHLHQNTSFDLAFKSKQNAVCVDKNSSQACASSASNEFKPIYSMLTS